MGYRVTRWRLRQVIHDTDPINRALHWGNNLHVRWPYSVPGPNSLWHIGMQHGIWFTHYYAILLMFSKLCLLHLYNVLFLFLIFYRWC